MAIRFIRIDGAYTPTRGKRAFSADGEINGQPHHFETRADNVIEALEVICERLRRDFKIEIDDDDWRC
jgi:hypothetical protein